MSYQNESFSIQQLPGEPIIIVSILEKYDFSADPEEANKLILPFLNSLECPVFWIVDFQPFFGSGKSISLDPLIFASNKSLEAFRHPNIRQTLFVPNNQLMELVAQGFNSQAFGNLTIKVFATLDDALVFARAGNK